MTTIALTHALVAVSEPITDQLDAAVRSIRQACSVAQTHTVLSQPMLYVVLHNTTAACQPILPLSLLNHPLRWCVGSQQGTHFLHCISLRR